MAADEAQQALNRRAFLHVAGGVALGSVLGACGRRRENRQAYHASPGAQIIQPQTSGFRYTVQSGDTLSSISRVSGISVATIQQANGLKSTLIRPGDVLLLPGVAHLEPDPLAGQTSPVTTTTAVSGTYRLQARHTWTRQNVGSNHNKMGSVRRITIHHTGEHAGLAGLSDREVIRRIENYHRNERKWAAIGYHYIIGKDGTVYEGRPATIQGAHVASNNKNNLGISVMGDFHRRLPTDAQIQALVALTSQQRRRFGVTSRNIYGHRDLGQSVCPGDTLYAWMQKNRSSLVG
jgi:LysM repeat protein